MPSAETKHRLRDRHATEEALIAAAAAAFAEKGYEKATTRSIALAANCSEGLIQRYFNGKEGLLLAAIKQGNKECDQSFLERPLCSSLADEARQAFAQAARFLGDRSEQVRIVMSRVLLDPSFRADLNRISGRGQSRVGIEARLARYASAGVLAPNVDVRSAAELLMTLTFELGFMHREIHQTGPAELQRLTEGFAILFGQAVSAPTVSRRRGKR